MIVENDSVWDLRIGHKSQHSSIIVSYVFAYIITKCRCPVILYICNNQNGPYSQHLEGYLCVAVKSSKKLNMMFLMITSNLHFKIRVKYIQMIIQFIQSLKMFPIHLFSSTRFEWTSMTYYTSRAQISTASLHPSL